MQPLGEYAAGGIQMFQFASRVIIAFFVTLSSVPAFAQIELFVAVNGNDRSSGRSAERRGQNGPFATITRARDEIRQLKGSNQLSEGAIVYVRGGTYHLNEPLVFEPGDSGTLAGPIVYRNYPGEQPRISGGTPITNWHREPNGSWSAPVPEVRSGRYFRNLSVNGTRATRARTPNAGYFHIETTDEATDGLFTAMTGFHFREGDLKADWRNLQDVEVVVVHHWADAHLPIKQINPATRRVDFSKATRMAFVEQSKAPVRYYVDNVLEGLDAAGEWYLARDEARLFYIPRSNEQMDKATVVAARLERLLEVRGTEFSRVTDIRFEGLTFSDADYELPADESDYWQAWANLPGVIMLEQTERITIQQCTIENVGTTAIELNAGAENVIARNLIQNNAAGGIHINGWDLSRGWDGAEPDPNTRDNVISGNRIEQLGKTFHGAVAVSICWASNSLISDNDISYINYSAISVGCSWGYDPTPTGATTIERNRISNIGTEEILSDLAAIYLVGNSPGIEVTYNRIENVQAAHLYASGIYLDEGSSGVLVQNNLTLDTQTAGFMLNYGRDNQIINNVFGKSTDAMIFVGKDQGQKALTIERNIFAPEMPVKKNSIGGGAKGKHIGFRNNTYVQTSVGNILYGKLEFHDWQASGQDLDSARYDTSIPLDSEVIAPGVEAPIGFEPLDFRTVGVTAAGALLMAGDEPSPSTRRRGVRP